MIHDFQESLAASGILSVLDERKGVLGAVIDVFRIHGAKDFQQPEASARRPSPEAMEAESPRVFSIIGSDWRAFARNSIARWFLPAALSYLASQ